MICKKCGAYNPDHATFCKVCAASLKEQPDIEEETPVADAEEVVEEELRPRRGTVKAPDFSSARHAASFKAALKADEPDEEEDENEEEMDEEEDVKPARSKARSSRPAAPVKKRRILDEEDEDDEDDDEEDEDEYDEDDSDAEKLESEPKTTRFARSSGKKRRVVEDDDEDEDEDDDDEEDEEDFDEDGDDDGYEEYEPTPPRRKKSGQSKGNSGGSSIVVLLIVCLLAILLIIVGIIAFCNIKGGATKSKLPSFLQFNCAGKATTEKTTPTQQLEPTAPVNTQDTNPTEAPVTGTQVDYSATKLEELVDSEGKPCISISMTSRPGDIVTIVLPNQDDYVVQNNEASDVPYLLTIPKSCFFPNTPLTESIYTVTPQILVAHADGTQESLHVDSFDITFPTIQLELVNPAEATIPEEGIMAGEGNEIFLEGKVDDHTVTVTVNGQPVTSMYEGGKFEYTYTVSGDDSETVTIEASKSNCVSTSYSFIVTPYIFIPEEMPLTVESDFSKLRADKNNKVTVTGTTAPGATLTATPTAEYQSAVVCGSPSVDAEGKYSFEVTFGKDYYGIASITIHAKKDGYEEGETSCRVTRMYADRKAAINGFNKNAGYHEVPSTFGFDKVLANPTDGALYRFEGKVVSVDEETGVITFAAKSSTKETTNIYVLNAVNNGKWKPKVNTAYKIYCTLNGLYSDGTSLYVTAWFIP